MSKQTKVSVSEAAKMGGIAGAVLVLAAVALAAPITVVAAPAVLGVMFVPIAGGAAAGAAGGAGIAGAINAASNDDVGPQPTIGELRQDEQDK